MTRLTWTVTLASVFSLSTLFLTNSSQAAILNGSFETGFTNWTTFGNTSIQTGAFGSQPSQGTQQAFLSTDTSPSGNFAQLEQFLGLNVGTLDTVYSDIEVFGGSAIRQTFTANTGDILKFNWNFLTNEELPSFNNDFAFVTLNSLSGLADTNSLFSSSPTLFEQETGDRTFSHTLSTAGTYTLAIGVVNVFDDSTHSGLLVDRVTLTSNTEPVPEPSMLFGTTLVLGLATLFKRQGAKKHN